MSQPAPRWYVYILKTCSGRLYTGITTDVDRRFQEHVDVYLGKGKKGAKFFRTDQPLAIVYQENCDDRSAASRRESCIKRLDRRQKLQLVAEWKAR